MLDWLTCADKLLCIVWTSRRRCSHRCDPIPIHAQRRPSNDGCGCTHDVRTRTASQVQSLETSKDGRITRGFGKYIRTRKSALLEKKATGSRLVCTRIRIVSFACSPALSLALKQFLDRRSSFLALRIEPYIHRYRTSDFFQGRGPSCRYREKDANVGGGKGRYTMAQCQAEFSGRRLCGRCNWRLATIALMRDFEANRVLKSLVNAESLTTSAVSRVFSLLFYQNSDTLLRRRTNCVFFCRFCSSVSP